MVVKDQNVHSLFNSKRKLLIAVEKHFHPNFEKMSDDCIAKMLSAPIKISNRCLGKDVSYVY